MSESTVFIGDVHGNATALRGLLQALGEGRSRPEIVFLGDYINKGPDSAAVMNALIPLAATGRVTLLRGNHESALITAIETGDLAPFLKMGGAMTVRSYVKRQVGADVLDELVRHLPKEHLTALQTMPETYETDELFAQHAPPTHRVSKFMITAHAPVGELPQIGPHSARIDTGCGQATGRLTAFHWPCRTYTQVDAHGVVIDSC